MRIALSLCAMSMALSAITLNIGLDDGAPITTAEKEAFIADTRQKQRITIDKKEAERILTENRRLADGWIKEDGLTENELLKIRFDLERAFSERLIRKHQEKIEIDDDVLKSYYMANKDEFVYGTGVSFKAYTFGAFNEAAAFYAKFKDNYSSIPEYVNENNITVVESTRNTLSSLHPVIESMLLDHNKTNYITAPGRFKGKFVVLDVLEFTEDIVHPYNKAVKKNIRNKLYYKTKSKSREMLLEKYAK